MLKRLTNASGVSGAEDEVRDIIKAEIKDYVDEYIVDAMGNLIAFKGDKDKVKLMFAAHMDEVGFMITHIEKTGEMRFQPVGGIDPRVVLAKKVFIGKAKIPAVIGMKAVHLLTEEEESNIPKFKDLFMDAGFTSDKEVEKAEIKRGDFAVFPTEYREQDGVIFAKALDDRIGCAIMVELVKKTYSYPVTFAFTVQEEVGLRGANVAGYSVHPEYAIILEGTGAGDFPQKKDIGKFPAVGKGPVITIMDKTCICDRKLTDLLIKIAEDNNIPYQIKKPGIGGTDAGVISKSKEGVKCGVVALPARYIHSPVSVAKRSDIDNMIKLVSLLKEVL